MKSSTSRHRRKSSGRTTRVALCTVLPACASAAAVWGILDAAQPQGQQPAQTLHDGTVQLVGQVVAVSPDSITTRSDDGTTMTFRITPTTTQISTDGAPNPVTGTAFSVNETITVMGVVNDGTPVATALADQNAGNGPPMDAI
jgi:hypothetical protein